jgi:hypothetical protein
MSNGSESQASNTLARSAATTDPDSDPPCPVTGLFPQGIAPGAGPLFSTRPVQRSCGRQGNCRTDRRTDGQGTVSWRIALGEQARSREQGASDRPSWMPCRIQDCELNERTITLRYMKELPPRPMEIQRGSQANRLQGTQALLRPGHTCQIRPNPNRLC